MMNIIEEDPCPHFFNVCLFLSKKERQNASRGGAGREGDTESKASSELSVQSLALGSNP